MVSSKVTRTGIWIQAIKEQEGQAVDIGVWTQNPLAVGRMPLPLDNPALNSPGPRSLNPT